ncbi:DUF397 domain-containing protein [Haloechinothrix sp. LS1_15]|uniref:DUF397 domain-containing protein n=1 Tax=Haloechinothrix sp. LS1_15 TaxID=2652248 RepID=UPI00294B2947|nr:DUF397 domain-containing protein [Haloechinothrix sp. LS1_15]
MTWHTTMTGWFTSSYTHHEENACVEVGRAADLIGIRDTKQAAVADEARPVLVLPGKAFRAFVDAVK